MALAVRADVRGLGVKLAHKFVTVESIPLLGDNFWKQLQVSNFFFPQMQSRHSREFQMHAVVQL